MGFFKKLLKKVEKPFRTGRSSALARAREAADDNRSINERFLGLVEPLIQKGGIAFDELNTLSNEIQPQNFAEIFDQVQGSTLADKIIEQRGRTANQFFSATGGRNSGARLKALTDIPTEVLLGLTSQQANENIRTNNQRLDVKRILSQMGLSQTGASLAGIGGITSANNANAQAFADAASNREGILGGILGGAGKVLGASKLASSAGIMGGLAKGAGALLGFLSDARVKENIVKIGQLTEGINIYSYNYIGNDQQRIGLIAQEVESVFPDLVIEKNGYKHILYEAA